MTYLFDASSILNLVKKGFLHVFSEGATIDLAFYEALNAVWKEHFLLKKIDGESALALVDVLHGVFDVLDVYSIKGFEEELFNLALSEKITVYDASYIHVAMKKGFPLVTDDAKLREKAKKHVETLTSREVKKEAT
jgi:predicted nucleic acid-binding protein